MISPFLLVLIFELILAHKVSWLSGHDNANSFAGDASHPTARRNFAMFRDYKSNDSGFYLTAGRWMSNAMWYYDGTGPDGWTVIFGSTASENVVVDGSFNSGNRPPDEISHFGYTSTNQSGWMYSNYDLAGSGKLYEFSFELEQWRRVRDDSGKTQSFGSSGDFTSGAQIPPHLPYLRMYFREETNSILMFGGIIMTTSGSYGSTGQLCDLYEYSINTNQYRWIAGQQGVDQGPLKVSAPGVFSSSNWKKGGGISHWAVPDKKLWYFYDVSEMWVMDVSTVDSLSPKWKYFNFQCQTGDTEYGKGPFKYNEFNETNCMRVISGFSSSRIGSYLLLMGGFYSETNFHNSIFAYSMNSNQWKWVGGGDTLFEGNQWSVQENDILPSCGEVQGIESNRTNAVYFWLGRAFNRVGQFPESDFLWLFEMEDTCFDYNASDPRVCSGRGNCVGIDQCECDLEWTGDYCQLPAAHGIHFQFLDGELEYFSVRNNSVLFGCTNARVPMKVSSESMPGKSIGDVAKHTTDFSNSYFQSNTPSAVSECLAISVGPNDEYFYTIASKQVYRYRDGITTDMSGGTNSLHTQAGWGFVLANQNNDAWGYIEGGAGDPCCDPMMLDDTVYYVVRTNDHADTYMIRSDYRLWKWGGSQDYAISINSDVPVHYIDIMEPTNQQFLVAMVSGKKLYIMHLPANSTKEWTELPYNNLPEGDLFRKMSVSTDGTIVLAHGTAGASGWPVSVGTVLPYSCFGIEATDASVCGGGRGFCFYPDNCTCLEPEKYGGLNCSDIVCHGVVGDDVCSRNGECVDYNQCKCSTNYFGLICNVTTCFDQWNNETGNICSDHGTCRNFDKCECLDGYYGKYCNITTCFGNWNNETGTFCNGHGKCENQNSCECEDDYFSQFCNVTSCFEKWNNETGTCNDRGNCVLKDTCKCDEIFYYGSKCEVTTCYDTFSNETGVVCSGKGLCVGYNNCTCFGDFHGPKCQWKEYFEFLRGERSLSSGEKTKKWPNGTYTCFEETSRPGGRSRHGGAIFGGSGAEQLFVFGGFGVGEKSGVVGHLNDLWKFDTVSKKWCFVKGNSTVDVVENNFGASSRSKYDEDHVPFGRSSFGVFATSFSFFVFGGSKGGASYTLFSESNNQTNELWEFAVVERNANSRNSWRLLQNEDSGSKLSGQPDIRSSMCIGKKFQSTSSRNDMDPVYLFGGGNSRDGIFDDVWKYDIMTNIFTKLLAGKESFNESFRYPQLDWNSTEFFENTPKGKYEGHSPPSRFQHSCWVGAGDHFYIFGGTLRNKRSTNDVWVFNTTQNAWSWVFGEIVPNEESSIVAPYEYSGSNSPGPRSSSILFLNQDTLSFGGLLFFGGVNWNTGDRYSDVWSFSEALNEFKFVNGSMVGNVVNERNEIGSRYDGIGCRARNKFLFIFGGEV